MQNSIMGYQMCSSQYSRPLSCSILCRKINKQQYWSFFVRYECGWNTHSAESLGSSFLNLYYAGEIANVGLKLQELVPYISKNAKKLHTQ